MTGDVATPHPDRITAPPSESTSTGHRPRHVHAALGPTPLLVCKAPHNPCVASCKISHLWRAHLAGAHARAGASAVQHSRWRTEAWPPVGAVAPNEHLHPVPQLEKEQPLTFYCTACYWSRSHSSAWTRCSGCGFRRVCAAWACRAWVNMRSTCVSIIAQPFVLGVMRARKGCGAVGVRQETHPSQP